MLATRVIEKAGMTVTTVASFEALRQMAATSEIAYAVLDANRVSVEDLSASRKLLQKARLIVLNGSEDLRRREIADVVISSPLKPADLRVALG